MREELGFETGLVTYCINGKCEISFNPTDGVFVKRLYDAFEHMESKQEHYRDMVEKTANKKEIFDVAQTMDAEMRELIDGTLGDGICDALFGEMNVYAMADGLPVWCNLMLTIIDKTDTAFAREQKAMNPRIKKYTDKYNRK